ncbi:MAG: pyrroline-5-carboxylate reductase [Lentisphaerota bacterium]
MKNADKISFIGAGRMATALAAGLIKKGFSKSNVSAFDVSESASAKFAEKTGVRISKDISGSISDADIVLLAVKPQNVSEALAAARPLIKDKLLISILAGTRIETLKALSGCQRIVRVMPNTPALVGEGISAFCHSDGLSASDISLTENILGAVGAVCLVKESQMDAVTGLSGSGPAYVFDFIQALSDGGVAAGLPRDVASRLAAQTVKGAACLVIETGEHPSVLRDQVTSPGGTTARGLSVLEKNAFRGIVSEAVTAAAERSKELGKKE